MSQRIEPERIPPAVEKSASALWALLGLVSAVAVVIVVVASGFAAA